MRNKYNARRTKFDGIVFDSGAEAARYQVLKLMERAGKIAGLELQPRFLLQDSFVKGGKKYRPIEYVADFAYIENGRKIVEDVKGMILPAFMLKRKLWECKYPDLELRITR